MNLYFKIEKLVTIWNTRKKIHFLTGVGVWECHPCACIQMPQLPGRKCFALFMGTKSLWKVHRKQNMLFCLARALDIPCSTAALPPVPAASNAVPRTVINFTLSLDVSVCTAFPGDKSVVVRKLFICSFCFIVSSICQCAHRCGFEKCVGSLLVTVWLYTLKTAGRYHQTSCSW